MSKATERQLESEIQALNDQIEKKKSALEEIRKKPEIKRGALVRVVDGRDRRKGKRFFYDRSLAIYLYEYNTRPHVLGVDIGGKFDVWEINEVEPIDTNWKAIEEK